ncbi:hypothetical protein [Floricoccus penangensis]|uniref:hypothetical protein n=1 Tax=Floricoccus penangensis TaxID=1859475 RepID=UPI00204237AD|nr:hypothetical protein [Floricoccus penangensis]URZ87207.1 hypothetical protein KIW23_09005 [Floricoccus penangensis]
MSDLENSLYDRTLATHVVYNGYDIHVESVKLDTLIADIESSKEYIKKELEITTFKQRAFREYLQSITEAEYSILVKYFERESISHILDSTIDDLQEEIYEIETAVAFKYGLELPKEPIKLTGSIDDNLERLVALLG